MTLAYMDNHEFVDSIVYNKYNEKLKTSLFFDRKTKHEICVVYMHGYGSNRTEAVHIMKYLPTNISMCCFDFSGEGKSEGRIITFGQKEKDDIRAVLGYLRASGYKKFVLWGRSMGATCTLLFTLKEKPKDVVLQILDSPFVSFAGAAVELTNKKLGVPELIVNLALEALKSNMANKEYNPFQVNLRRPLHSDIPSLFIYSEEDEVINHRNSEEIISNLVGFFEKMVITESHNATRKGETIKKIIDIIKKYLTTKAEKKAQSSRKILTENFIHTSNENKKKFLNSDKKLPFEDYGIWVSSKEMRDSTKAEENGRVTMPSTPKSEVKRPRSSMKVYSRQANSGLEGFEMEMNFPKSVKNETRIGFSRPKKNQLKLSHEIYF